jgi:hypothetical protein
MKLPHNLYDAVLHVASSEPSISQWGTAFIVHRNEAHSYLLTCAHVVRDVGGERRVIVGGQAAEVVIYREDIDVAVLKVQGIVHGEEIPLRVRDQQGGRFSTAGFAKLGTNYRKMDLYGAFGRSDQLYARGKLTGHLVWELEVDGQNTFEPGWSGSPVFDETNNCVGMVTLKQGPRGFAISIEVIRDAWLDIPKTLFPDPPEAAAILPKRKPRMNRDDEIDAFACVASGRDQETRVLIIGGPSGMGKTELLREYQDIARRHNLRIKNWTLAQQLTVEAILLEIQRYFGGRRNFPKYYGFRSQVQTPPIPLAEYFRILTEHLFADLSVITAHGRLFLFIDEYEKGDQRLRTWIGEHFLPGISTDLPLVAVVAGQATPDLSYGEEWVKRFLLQRLPFECWTEHLQQQGIWRSPEQLKSLYEDPHIGGGGQPIALSIITRVLQTEWVQK